MARPKVPLISRRKALEAALRIMDTEGLDALSIRRLAVELGVNGASLYHHFANKDEILAGAAEIALSEVRTPTETAESWPQWLPRNSRALRKALLEHPALVPVIIRKTELGMGLQMMESTAQRLLDEGVPLGAIIPLLDALEMLAIGSVVLDTRGDDAPSPPRGSVLAKAEKSRGLSREELYEVVSAAVVEAVAAAAKEQEGRPVRKAGPRAASGKKSAPRPNLSVVAVDGKKRAEVAPARKPSPRKRVAR